jgi:hypothetical protein
MATSGGHFSRTLGMGWNFPARASSSHEGSEPIRAELGHFNFRAETELTKEAIF